MTTGSDLKERVQVQSLLYYPEADAFAWEVKEALIKAGKRQANR